MKSLLFLSPELLKRSTTACPYGLMDNSQDHILCNYCAQFIRCVTINCAGRASGNFPLILNAETFLCTSILHNFSALYPLSYFGLSSNRPLKFSRGAFYCRLMYPSPLSSVYPLYALVHPPHFR